MKTLKNAAGFILPSLICVITAYILYVKPEVLTGKPEFLEIAPYIVLIIGAILAWRFNKSCIFFILLVIAASFFGVLKFDGEIGRKNDIYNSICVLLPVNIIIFSSFKERGILSSWGILRLSLIGGQLYYLYVSLIEKDWFIFDYFKNKYIALPAALKSPIPQLGLFLFLIAFLFICLRLAVQKCLREAYYLAVLTVSFLALHNKNALSYRIFVTAAGLILIVAILQSTYFMAFYDELTGLPSRRALKQDMMKLGIRYTIAMLDIDFFKKFNDTYGHDTGDEVLKLVASVLRNVNGGGKAYRYGGEEFTLLFPGKSKEAVLPYLEELREKVSKKGYTYKKTSIKNKKTNSKRNSKRMPAKSKIKSTGISKVLYVTVSIGAAQRDDKSKNTEAVLKAADEALYKSKKKGRNCVSI